MAGREGGESPGLFLFLYGHNPVMGAPSILTTSSKPDHLPEAPPPNTVTVGVSVSTYEFGRGLGRDSAVHSLIYFDSYRSPEFEAVWNVGDLVSADSTGWEGLSFKALTTLLSPGIVKPFVYF